MRNFLLLCLFGVATLVASKLAPILMIPTGIGLVVFFCLALKQNHQAAKEGSKQINDTHVQLRKELTEVQMLALSKLSGADDELKNKVVELLIAAGWHLGNPHTNSRVVYGSSFFINWNREGIALVAQAKQLIDAYAASK